MKIQILVAFALFATLNSFAITPKTDCKSEDHYLLMEKTALKAHVEKNDLFLVDVNNEKTFKENHIGNAINYAAHKTDFEKMLPADKGALIVAYCGSEKCTAWKTAAEIACAKGYTNVQHFKPGIKGWLKN